jgi:hypothetical protein
MAASAQALYLNLSMSADDDGFCNQVSTAMFKAHASVSDLELLLQNRYIYQFENGVIVIKHWRMANALRKDRYTPTAFKEELAMLSLDENNAYTMSKDGMVAAWLPDGCQVVAERLPQVSIGKERLDKNSIEKKSENAHRFGGFSNVVLTQEEYSEWLKECPKAEYYIERLSEYIENTGKKYASHLTTMRKWWDEDKKKETPRSYDLDAHTERAMTKTLEYKKV